MAYDYKNLPVLSKVKIGEQIYYLKDAEVRALIDSFGDAVTYNVDKTFSADSENIATSKAIATYLEGAIAGLTGAMHFAGVKTEEEFANGTLAGTAGDVISVGSAEYVYDGTKWVLIGDEGVYATVAGVEAAYVKKSLTIAGINLEDAITADELKTALGLKALAYKDSASGTIEGVVTGVQDATYTPAGGVEVTLDHTSTAVASTGTFKPAGDVTGNVTAAGSVSIAKSEAGTQISGTVSAPTITVTPNTAQVQHIASLGALPTYTAAKYTAPSVTEKSAQFASEGVVAAMDAEDTEMLVFTAAGKASALTETGFNAGSYEAAQFNAGALPEFGDSQTVVTGIAKAEATTFAGSEVAIAATFAGTEAAVNVSGNYDKASVKTATFSGTEATISHGVTTGSKTVTVS